jgi:hypothetical protein
MAKSSKPAQIDLLTIDIHELLTQRRQIAAIWSIEDVQQIRPDLSDDQAWEVLQQCDRKHDCNLGLTWDAIEYAADDMFPQPDNHSDIKGGRHE